MLMNRFNTLLIVIIFVFQLFCSSKVSDTTSSSEVTNGIMGTVHDNGNPAESVMVVLLNTDDWKMDALNSTFQTDTVFSDSDGYFNFGVVDSGIYSVLLGDTNKAALLRDINSSTNGNLGNITLTTTSKIKGAITSEGGSVDKIFIKDTYISTFPDSQNNFIFSGIPADSTTLYTVLDNLTRSINYTAGHAIPPSTTIDKKHLQAIANGFLLDNFDDGDNITHLDWFTKKAKWYAYNDSQYGGNSVVIPASALDDVTTAYTTDSSYNGKSLKIKFILGDAISGPFGSVACSLGTPGKEYVNLENLTELAFMIKGSGTMRINFITEYVDLNHDGIHRGDFGKTINATNTWTEYRIPADGLLPEPGTKIEAEGTTWSDVNKSVRSLIFGSWANAGDTVEIALDNIRLYGIDPETYGH